MQVLAGLMADIDKGKQNERRILMKRRTSLSG